MKAEYVQKLIKCRNQVLLDGHFSCISLQI